MIEVRAYELSDLAAMARIWNDVVRAGRAFPQYEELTLEDAEAFFADQTRSAVAVDEGTVVGLYILHPNNVGRCAHVANASFAVDSTQRGRGIGRALVSDCVASLRSCGFNGLQFNAVVVSNTAAWKLYESLGFERVGTIPHGFINVDGVAEDIYIYYHAA